MDKPGLRDALPQPQQSDTRNDQFWGDLDSSLSAASSAPPLSKTASARNLDVGLGDLARGVGAGALELVGGIGELAGQASEFGKENAGKQGGDYLEQARANMASKLSPVLDFVAGAGDLAKSGAESLTEGMSSDAKEAMNRRLVDETPEGRLTLGDGAGDIDVWAMKMAQGVGSLVPTLLAGGVTGVAAKATLGRAVTASMIKRGATQQVAEAVAAKTVSKLATGAAVTTGATGSVGSAGVNAKESVLGMSYDELAASDTFRQAFTRIDQDQQTLHLTDDEKLALAREETANVASRATMSDAKTWGAAAMGSMMGDAMLFKMLAGKAAAGGMLKGAAKGAVGEGVGETLEEGVQQYAVNEALNEVAAADIDPMKGVVSSAIEGGLIGMGTGGAVGAVGGARGGKHASQEDGVGTDPVAEPSAPVTEDAAGPAVDPNFASVPLEDGEQAPSASQAEGELNPLGPSASQFDELRDVPAYLRRDDTAARFKGMAADSEVQRALASEFGQSVQELVASQMQAGDQGKSLYERAQAGELGLDPFAGNKSAQQVAMENQRLALPLKDVIFAGDANAKPVGEAVAAPGDHDDRQAGPGPQFRGGERTHWQNGQEGDLLPPEAATAHPVGELPGATIDGEAREVGNELPHRNVVYGNDLRAEQQRAADLARRERELNNQPPQIGQSETLFAGGTPGADPRNSAYTPPKLSRDQVDTSMGEQSTRDPRSPVAQSIEQAGSATDSVFGPLKSLRITRKGKPFATEKEAAMASRKDQEMPVPLNGGGFGVAAIGEVQQAQSQQGEVKQPSSNSAQQDRQDGKTEIAQNGMVIVHGSGNPGMSEQDIQIVRASGQKQGKKGRVYGGFYGTSEQDAHQAQAYADMMGGTPTLYDVKIKPGTKVLHKQGDITRLSESYINELVSQGYGVVTGTDPRGQTEHVVIDKSAVASMAPRGAQATPSQVNDTNVADIRQPSDQPAKSVSAETVPAPSATAGEASQLAPAIDTGYRDVIPSSEQSEVTHGQPTPIPEISSERSGDQPGAGDPVATGVGQTTAELAERAGPGDPADGAPLTPLPVTQPGEENALTAPAPAGVAVSEEVQPEQARTTAGPAAAPTPWSGMIDNPDGTITLEGGVAALKSWAKDNGVKAIPGKGGLVVSTTSVAKVRQLTTPATSEPVRQIEAARAEIAPEPTEAQKEAGNYKKGHIKLQGLDIALENPKGSTRSGTDQDGKAWQSTMAHDYGYIKRTLGADGDHVDVFIGDKPDSETVYVVDQVDPKTGKFDEHKVMMGFSDEQAAREGYLGNYEEGWKGLGAIKAMPVEDFKRWVKEGDTTKPVKGLRGTGSGKADVNAMVAAAKAERKAERAKAIEAAGTGHPDLDEVIATFSKEPIHNDRNASLPAQKKVYDTIKEARGLHDAYRFSTLLDSNWQNDRDEAIKLAKDVYSEIGAKANSKLSAAKPMPAAGSKETITDFGQKIGGARKDVWAAYRDSVQGETVEEIKTLPLSKAWPAPDYQKLIDGGVPPKVVAIIRAARDSIPAKPKIGWRLQGWADAVKNLRDASLSMLDDEVMAKEVQQRIADSKLHLARGVVSRAELYEAVGHQRSLADLKLERGEYSLFGGVKYDPPKTIWSVQREGSSSTMGAWPRMLAQGDTKQQAIDAFKRQYEALTAEASKPKAISFDIYSHGAGKGWVVGKKVGRNYLDLSPPFEKVGDARAYREEHQDELVAKLAQRKAIPLERRDINQPRVGEDMRAGQDVTMEQFANAFGFRGVEFGNWVEKGRRQQDLNNAYDAMMDLAAIIGVPPKALSLNGELGLAFGARGTGGITPAAAHYERGKVVINLTKMNGAGSLGHEWWHALDNYFSRLRSEGADYMSEALDVSLAARGSAFANRGSVRKEMVEAYGAVMRAIKQTSLKARSQKLDSRRSKAYWTTDVELSARAFESYLIAKLQDQGASNDYLVNIVSESQWDAEAALGVELEGSYPYATAGEVQAIRAGFDQFIDTLEHRQDGDRTILFSKQAMAQGEKPAKHLTRKEAELVTKEWFKQYRGASGIDVQIHATQAELEKALGLAAQDGLIRRAAFDDDSGTLHVAADTIANPKRMREILRHEVLAHYGLANVLGDGEYTKLMSRLIQSQKDPSMKPVWDWVNTHYADEDIGTQAEEVVAHLAELEQGAWGRGWDRVVAWVTRALRAVGFVPDGITAAETRVLIESLGKKMKRRGPDDGGPDGGKKFSQEAAQPEKKSGLKMSQTNTAADAAMEKLNLGPKPDIIDKTKASLNKLRQVDRGVVSSWIDRVIKKANTEVLDALAPIKYAEEAAGITDAADSGYVAARMATGAASTMQATMLYGLPEWNDGVIQRKAGTGEKDALLGIFADLGADLHNWLGWMAGHRAELLMAQGRENLLDANDIAALKGQGNGKEAKFLDAKARWNRLNAATLDLAQEAGLFTKEARAEFESEWYIPFFRESDDGDVIAPFKTKGIANQNSGIKKLKGGEANTNDLLENIFTSTSKLIDASMKNMAAQKTVWNLADTGIIEVIPKPNKMDYQALANGKDRIMVKLEGEDYMIRVEDPDLYRAMTFFDRKPFSAMVNVAAKAKRLLTAGVTASPEFMLRNFLRDSLSSWAISKDGFRPVIDSIKGVKKTLAMDGSTIDVMFSGASFLGGYVNGNDPEAMADTVRKSLRRKGMTPEQIARYEKSIIRNAAQAKGVVANAWEKYNRYGEAFENANREAVYAAAIKAGKSHAQAAFESKDLMDFSMLGASRTMQVMTQLLPFFNARVQGLGKLTRELRDNPRAIAKRAGMITAASLALLAANWDDERYEELPDWDKDTNWHFFVGDQHFRIPKPFEIGVLFGTIPERMVRAMGDKDTGAQFGKAVARAIGDTFALNPTPQIVKPLVEATFNYDTFRGGPIDGPQDLNVQAEARYNEQTSLLMRELGELTGFSPKQLEHLVIGYTGTMGSYVMAAADGLIRASRPGESASWRADEIPLVKAVYRGTGPAKSTQHMEEFYRMLNEVNQLKRTVDQYRSEGLTDKARELLEEQGGILKSRRSLSRTQQQVRVVRNKIELIQRDRTLAAEEKRRRIDEMLARRNDLVYQAVNKNKANWE
ncbi:LPD38 domain-containing protein [Aeromonas media]|uniref:LPD38 domain-containing protein n=1 Tax=Aeromonas media TaxID=651 RepID=UPI00214C53A0|nr:LPD38 domain-containing protein [Aeromonas media]